MQSNRQEAETNFGPTAWLVVLIVFLTMCYSLYDVTYRNRLPTEGWEIGEAGDSTIVRDLTGLNPDVQPGDTIVSIEGMPVDWNTFENSGEIKAKWRVGETLQYEIQNGGEIRTIPVTLGNWPSGGAYWRDVVRPLGFLSLVTGVIQFVLALFVFGRKPGSPSAGAFLIIVSLFLFTYVSELVPFTYGIWIDPIAMLLQGGLNWIAIGVLMPFSLVWFGLTFPRPKPIYAARPWLSLVLGGAGAAIYIFLPGSELLWFWFVLSFFIAIALLVHSAFTMRDAVSRAQIRWGVGGFLINIGITAIMLFLNTTRLVSISNDTFALVGPFLSAIMTGMIAIGILRYRLFDIDVIIRRTLQYALLTGILLLIYFGGVIVLQEIFSSFSGEANSPLVTVISTLGIAALFNPLRLRTQEWIDRRFYRSKFNAEKALSDFAVAARDEVDLDQLVRSILDFAETTVQPERTSIWLEQGRGK